MQQQVKEKKLHPMQAKKDMARDIVTRFWSEKEAQQALEQFESLFQKQDFSKAQVVNLGTDLSKPIWIVELLKQLGAIKTSSEGKRLIESKSVSINEQHIINFKEEVKIATGTIIKVGKHRIYKIK